MSMELILSTPVENLVPALLKWNNEELMGQVNEAMTYYSRKAYNDSNIAEAKADKAKLNNFVKSLNDERIRIGKVYTAPYEKFKGEVDEVQLKVKSVIYTISEAIDGYEVKRQADKKALIESYYNSHLDDTLKGFVKFEQIFKSNWLNTTSSMKSVQAEIDQILDRIKTEFSTIKELNSPDETTLLTLYFRSLSLASALMENAHLQAERARIEQLRQNTVESPKVDPIPEKDIDNAIVEEIDDRAEIRFKVTATREQFRILAQFLKDNKISYEKI